MVYRYRGHQYHYSGHCVSFMQNTVKIVDTLQVDNMDQISRLPLLLAQQGSEIYQKSSVRVRQGMEKASRVKFIKA